MSQSNEEDVPEIPIPMSMIDDELPIEPRRGLRKFGGREITWKTMLVGALIVGAILAVMQTQKSASEATTPASPESPTGDDSAGNPTTPTSAVAALVGTLNLRDTPLSAHLTAWSKAGRLRAQKAGSPGLPETPRSADEIAAMLQAGDGSATPFEISRLALAIAQTRGPASLAISHDARYAKVSLEHRDLVVLSENTALDPLTGATRPRDPSDAPLSGDALRATELGMQAIAELRTGHPGRAAETVRRAREIHESDLALQLLQGQIQVESDQATFGAATIADIVTRAPNAWSHYQLGMAEMAAERLFKAHQAFAQATSLDPTLAEAWVARANLQIQRLEWMPQQRRESATADAHTWLDRAMELDPNGLEVGLLQAQFHMLEGDMEAATATLVRLSKSHSDAVEPRLILGQLALQEARFSDARSHLAAARTANPDHPEILHLLALAHLSDTQWTEGIAVLEHLLTLRPDDVEVRVHLAQALQESGQNLQARAMLAQQVERFPADRQAPLLLAQLALNAGDSADALGHAREAIRRTESVDARVLEMVILATLERRAEAFTIADALEKSVPGSWSLLAEALAAHGEMELLRVFLEHVLETDPRQEDLRVLLAMAHLLMNNPSAAKDVKASALAKLDSPAREALASKFEEGFAQADAILSAAREGAPP